MSTNSTEVIGAGVPPAGVAPNFEHPHDNLKTVSYVTQTLTLVIVTSFVVLRFYGKHVALGNQWHTEDCTSLACPVSWLWFSVEPQEKRKTADRIILK